ncbi:MAG: hypothetical protein K2O37_03640 [Bacteroidales bacterium]|nr:hypothetical protein [Bacteroidales bacterium]
MKKIFGKILLASCAFAGVAALFPSCKPTPDDLTLYGAWEEKHYAVYDTNMASFSQHRMVLDCPGTVTDSFGNTFKGGEFTLYIKSTHKRSLSSYLSGMKDSTFIYQEYVQGQYRVDDARHLLDFDGRYYADSLFSTEADSSNTEYAFGKFQRNATYKLNDKFMILSISDSLSNPNNIRPVDLNHFYPVGTPYNCF